MTEYVAAVDPAVPGIDDRSVAIVIRLDQNKDKELVATYTHRPGEDFEAEVEKLVKLYNATVIEDDGNGGFTWEEIDEGPWKFEDQSTQK